MFKGITSLNSHICKSVIVSIAGGAVVATPIAGYFYLSKAGFTSSLDSGRPTSRTLSDGTQVVLGREVVPSVLKAIKPNGGDLTNDLVCTHDEEGDYHLCYVNDEE